MLQVTVKTLDAQNHSFSVPDGSTVSEFKIMIAYRLKITAHKQRLIFCGRVLQDDKKLSEYGVDGKVIHLVQSPPPQPQSTATNRSSGASAATGGPLPAGTTRQGTLRDGSSFLLGAFSIPQDVIDPAHVQNIVQDVVSGMGEWGRNATVMSRTSDDGSSVDVHIDLGHVPLQSEAQLRINQIRTMLNHANNIIQSLENAASGRADNASSDQRTDSERGEASGQDTTDGNPPQVEQINFPNLQNIPLFSQFAETTASSSSNTTTPTPPTSNASIDSSTLRAGTFSFSPLTAIPIPEAPSPTSSSFGEGLAHAARAAVAAAVAAASSAAVRAGSSVSVRHSVAVRAVDRDENSNQPSQRGSSESQNAAANSTEQQKPESDQAPEGGNQGVTAETSSGVTSSSSEPTSAAPTTTSTSTAPSNTPATNARREVTHPRIEVIANLWEEVNALNTRLHPHLQRCMEIIRSDATLTATETRQAQNMYNWISKIMHFLSHVYHSLSDMYVNFNQSAPRTLRVRIVSSSSSPAFFHSRGALPLHAQINISTPNGTSVVPLPPAFTASAASTATASTTRPTPVATSIANSLFGHTTEIQADTVTSTEGERPIPSAPPADDEQRPATATSTSAQQTEQSFVPLFGQSSPFVFMEMGPNRFESGSGRFDSGSGRFQLDRPNFSLLENFMDAQPLSNIETGSAPRTTAESERRQPQSSEPQQTTTTATSSRSVGGSAPSASLPRGASGVRLHAFPSVGMPFGSFDSFDPNLPCNSIWALDTSLRRRHNAGTSPSPTQTARMNLGVTPNAQGRQDDQFHNIISGLVSSLFNQPMQGGSTASTGETHEGPGFTMFATTTTINGRRRSRSAGPPANRNTSSTATRTTDLTSDEPMDSTLFNQVDPPRDAAASPPEPEFDFLSLLQGASNPIDFGLRRATFADIFQNVDDSSFVEGESVMRDLFICLTRELNFSDITALVCGCGEPLTRIRSTLQRFIREKILKNEEPTEENIDRAVEDIIAEGDEVINLVTTEANMKPDIDYEATMKNFARKNLKKLINLVLNEPLGTSFGSNLYAECRRVIMELVSLHNHCFLDGPSSFRRIFEQRIRDVTAGMGGVFRNMTWDDEYNNLPHMNVPFADLRQYLVHRLPSPESVAEAQRSQGTETSNPPQRDPNAIPFINDNVDSSEVSMPTEAGITVEVNRREVGRPVTTSAAVASAQQQQSLGNNIMTRNSSDDQLSQQLPDVIVGSEGWHNSVPREWVPIIARDIHRQRRQAPQNMFSDAYFGGMPSKRRKVMMNGPSTSSLLASPLNALSETLQQAISAAGVRPRTSIEQIKREASQDASLQKAFKEQLKCSIQERLHNDMDYNPDRYPNAEKYFNNQ